MSTQEKPAIAALLHRIALALIIPSLIYCLFSFSYWFAPNTSSISAYVLFIKAFTGLITFPLTILTGWLIIRRVKGNIIGVLLILVALGIPSTPIFQQADTSFQAISTWWNSSIFLPTLILLLFYFPTGQAMSSRSEKWILTIIVTLPLYTFFDVLGTAAYYGKPNPFFIPAFAPLRSNYSIVYGLFYLIPLVICVASLRFRYRMARQHQRAQIKWLIWSGSNMLLLLLGWGVITFAPETYDQLPGHIVRVLSDVLLWMLPTISIGNAILRHRLYDIDIIIRRTLIYSILSTILALIFFGGVTLAQSVFRTATGQSSDLAIVVSTLAIAALFAPLRRRVQNVIDRRFYRRKYDAEKTLAQFSQTLRDETDLASLKASMISVVQETMQPTHAALWINTKEGKV